MSAFNWKRFIDHLQDQVIRDLAQEAKEASQKKLEEGLDKAST